MTSRPRFIVGVASLAFALTSCAEVADPDSPSSVELVAGDPAGPVVARAEPLRFGVTFEARLDAASGQMEFFNVEPFHEGSPLVSGDIISVPQASYCEQTIDIDGSIGSGAPGTFEIYTVEGSVGTYEECFSDGVIPPYYIGPGVQCSDVTIRSFFDTPVDGVYAQIDEMVPLTGNAGYRHPWGGAMPPVGLSDVFGLWYYGDYGPTDGAVGDPSPLRPDENTVQWLLEYDETSLYFSGRVMAEASEICGDAIDNDCDGRADEDCFGYLEGADCESDLDCVSGFCEATGVCGPSTCENLVTDGAESDVDCGGACDGCALGESCFTNADCESNACRAGVCETIPWPNPGELVINEFMADPLAVPDSQGEWIELRYVGDGDVSLQDCHIRDNGFDDHRIIYDETLAGDDAVAFGRNANLAINGGVDVDYSLAAGEEPTGIVDSSVSTGTFLGGMGGGPSSQRCPAGSAMVGLNGTYHYPYIRSLQVVCRELGFSALGGDPAEFDFALGATTTLSSVGGGGVLNFSQSCPTGEVVGGFVGHTGIDGSFVNSIGTRCIDPAISGGDGADYGVSATPGATNPVVGYGGSTYSFTCPNGTVAIGYDLRAGSWIDGLTPVCREVGLVVEAGMTLANGGPDEIIVECGGQLIDAVAFDGTMVDAGVSTQLSSGTLSALENDDPDNFCFGESAYGAGDLGTPGGDNRLCEDPDVCPAGFWDDDDFAGTPCIPHTVCAATEIEITPPTATSDRVCAPDCDGNPLSGDIDGDGLCNNIDACRGDNSSGDSDADGFCNDTDICPYGPDDVDTDLDGLPAACDCPTGSRVVSEGVCGNDVEQIDGGIWGACARYEDDTIDCWGSDDAGVFADLEATENVAMVALGYTFGCVAQTDGNLDCYGFGGATSVPADIGAIIDIDGIYVDACAVEADGNVVCWGDNSGGIVSQLPTDLEPAVEVAVSGESACALSADGDVRCWGLDSTVPADLDPVSEIEAAFEHFCAIEDDGDVRCWGRSGPHLDVPADLGPVVDLSMSYWDVCALQDDGEVVCWGGAGAETDLAALSPPLEPATLVEGGYFFHCAVQEDTEIVCFNDEFGGGMMFEPSPFRFGAPRDGERVCGDGFIDAYLGEACDDGNDIDDDECSNACEAANDGGEVSTTVGSVLNSTGGFTDETPRWVRPWTNCTADTGSNHPWVVYELTNPHAEAVTVNIRVNWSAVDGFLHVYDHPFNPDAPTDQCIIGNDDAFGSTSFSYLPGIVLAPGTTYDVVLSTYWGFQPGTWEMIIETVD